MFAFCPILFGANGGQFDHLGRPFVPTDAERVRGKCDRAGDCGQCPYMTQWVDARIKEGWQVGWECDHCLRDLPVGKTADYRYRFVPGFYQSSRFRGIGDDREDVEPNNPLDGCTRCGWGSALLQLVLRRQMP